MRAKSTLWRMALSLFTLHFAHHFLPEASAERRHSNNWAVIVDTSVFWFNYRHIANALSIYRAVKDLGIPDSQIILMLADDMACNTRNSLKARMYNNENKQLELYGDQIEVDYRGNEVTVEAFLRVLSGRHPAGTPAAKRLDTDDGSNILIYMSGHGGDGFLKFRDSEELSSLDMAETFEQMFQKRRYKEILYMTDTCQATTMYADIQSPGIVSIGSSERGENSYSHHLDLNLGVYIIDRFTYYTLEFLNNNRERVKKRGKLSLQHMFDSFSPNLLYSQAGWNSTLSRSIRETRVSDFFASVLDIRVGTPAMKLKLPEAEGTKQIRTKDVAADLPTINPPFGHYRFASFP